MDSLNKSYKQNIAYDNIYRCLSALRYKLSTGWITEPNYTSNLIRHFAYRTQEHDVQYPQIIARITGKLEELGYSKPKNMGEGWYFASFEMRDIWSGDQQLMALLSESERNLMAQRATNNVINSQPMSGYYLTSLNSMGWINIDKLNKRPLTASLSISRQPNSSTFIILDEMSSVLQYSGEAMMLPDNMSVTVFSVMLKDNMPHYAVEKMELKRNKNEVELKYREGILKDIKSALQQAV